MLVEPVRFNPATDPRVVRGSRFVFIPSMRAGTGTAYDLSGSNRHSAVTGASTVVRDLGVAWNYQNNSTDKILVKNPQTFGAGTEFTFWQWFYSTASHTNGQGTSKAGSNNDIFCYSGFKFFCNVDRATTDGNRTTLTDLLPLNTWKFVAATYSEADGPRLWHGTRFQPCVEPTYADSTVGSGSTVADTNDVPVNNRSGSSSLAFGGRLGAAGWVARRLVQSELWAIQFAGFGPRPLYQRVSRRSYIPATGRRMLSRPARVPLTLGDVFDGS